MDKTEAYEAAVQIADEVSDGDTVMGTNTFNIDAILAIIDTIMELFQDCDPPEGKSDAITRLATGGRGSRIAKWKLSRVIRDEMGDSDRRFRKDVKDSLLRLGRDGDRVKKIVKD